MAQKEDIIKGKIVHKEDMIKRWDDAGGGTI